MSIKKIAISLLPLAFSAAASSASDPTLMSVNGNNISKSEFEYIYLKNSALHSDAGTLDDYLKLYADLKLKVEEAKSLGLDTTAAFRQEYAQYRAQAARPYLQDSVFYENFLRKMYYRMTHERELSQIFVAVKEDALPADTLAAFEKIRDAKKRIDAGESFEKIAGEYAGRPSYNGNIGYVAGFNTVLSFEDAIFSLKVGEVSDPIRSSRGYHIIRVNSERPALGEVQVAHIMKRFPKDAPADSVAAAKKAIDAVAARLQAGEDFFEVAKEETEHEYSKRRGGRISPFNFGESLAGTPFDSVAFSLKNAGDVSAPVRSWYGWHIIKLIDKKSVGTYESERSKIANYVDRMPDRKAVVQQAFIASLKQKYNYILNSAALKKMEREAAAAATDSVFTEKIGAWETPLITFANRVLTVRDFAKTLDAKPSPRENLEAACEAFGDSELTKFADEQLESQNREFRLLMEEYKDGMLMFAASNQEVWEKAANDEKGLKSYFKKNKADYAWETPRFKGMLVSCADKETEARVRALAKSLPADSLVAGIRKLNTDEKTLVRVDKGLFVKGENPVVDKEIFHTGNYDNADLPLVFHAKGGKILTSGPDEYTDVKGLVISDYQNYLESRWIEKLHKKYNVTVDRKVVDSMRK